jgi:hypothetical protein
MPFTLDIDFRSLVEYAVQEIRERGGESGRSPDIVALDDAIDRAMSLGCSREAALILMMRVGITNFTAEEADEVIASFIKTSAVASMIHEWAYARGVPLHPI